MKHSKKMQIKKKPHNKFKQIKHKIIQKQQIKLFYHRHFRKNILSKQQNEKTGLYLNIASIKNENLYCSICLNLLVYPSLLQCGHIFCLQCLQQHSKISKVCANCRQSYQNINQLQKSSSLTQLIQTYVKNQSNPQQLKDYNSRKLQFDQNEQNRSIAISFAIGGRCDFRANDKYYTWRQGQIIAINITDDMDIYLTINQLFRPYNMDEHKIKVFKSTSRNIARYRYFTNNSFQSLEIEMRESYEDTLEYYMRCSLINLKKITLKEKKQMQAVAHADMIESRVRRELQNQEALLASQIIIRTNTADSEHQKTSNISNHNSTQSITHNSNQTLSPSLHPNSWFFDERDHYPPNLINSNIWNLSQLQEQQL